MALTKITGQVINDTTGLVVGVTTVGGGVSAVDGFFSGIVTFSNDVSIAGTLTYEDVTNIDAVGLVTARNGIVVGSGITLSKDGDIFATGITTISENLKVGTGVTISPDGDGFFTGVVTATSYAGDGSALTGIDATQIVTGNTSVQTVDTGSDGHVKVNTEGSERVRITSTGEVGINMTPSNGQMMAITGRSGYDDIVQVTAVGTNIGARINLTNTGTGVARINATNNSLALQTGGTERIRIGSSGQLGIAGANYGTSGQVLQSQGSGSAVQWATPASGWVHGAEVSLNGNVSITLTDVPDGASHIRYLIRYMSFDAVAQPRVQLQKSTTGGTKSIITSNYQSYSTYHDTSGGSGGSGGNTDCMDIFEGYSNPLNALHGSVDVYRIGTNGSDGTNYLIQHRGLANYNGTLSANFISDAYIELGSSSTDFICGAKFSGNTGESFDNGYINQSYLLS